MGYYFVLEISNNGKVLLLENLADKKQIEAELIAFDTLVQNSKVKSQILQILPSCFILSPFTNGKDPYVFDGKRILFDISAVMQSFTQDSNISQNSIIELSNWHDIK